MKAKKIIIISLISIVLLICAILIFNSKIEIEYIPETEIEESDLRNTIVTLYFKKKDGEEIEKESRLIDSKELLLDPYSKLINMLIEGPQNENFEKVIPDGTKVNKVELIGNCLNIDFSAEFASNQENLEYEIQTIEKTLNELNEINEVEITVCEERIE